MNGFALDFASIASLLTSLLVLVACVLLWMRTRNTWALLALAGEAGSIACRLFLAATPGAFTDFPQLRIVWPLAGLVFSVGLAGYAWNEFEKARGRDSGVVQ